MKRILAHQSKIVLVLVALGLTVGFAVLCASSVAWAQAANFYNEPYSLTIDPDTCDLSIGPIDERGLGGADVTYTIAFATGDDNGVTLGEACQNNGGNFPSDPKKKADSAATSQDTTVKVKNGRVRNAFAEYDISAAFPSPFLKCPGGQRAVVICCKYTGVTLNDSTNGVVASISSASASFTFPNAPASVANLCQ